MALVVADLAVALRLSADGQVGVPQETLLSRLLGVGEAYVDLLIPGAPEPIRDECIIRIASYLYDQPTAGRRDAYANAWANSGAGGLAMRWVVSRVAGADGG